MADADDKKDPNPEEIMLDGEDDIEDIQEQDDGSAIVHLEGDKDETESKDFLENLAEELIDESTLVGIASELIDFIEQDKDSRTKRDEQYKEGLRRTGLGNDAPGGASFEGSSKVVHPILAESCIDFESRAIKELFPANGPVKMQIVGKQTDEKLARAERKVKFLNWQLTKQMSEYRPTLEQVLMQTPMGGSQYEKFFQDPRLNRPRTVFVPVDDILLPFACTDFYTSHRVTHVQHLTKYEMQERIDSGIYRDVLDMVSVPMASDKTGSAEANEKIEGKQDPGLNEDGPRDVYEIYTYLELKDDQLTKGEMAPYIVTIDSDSEKILAIYRNWKEDDELKRKLDWIVEYQFIPWRGAYGIGLPHLIGGLSGAATGALRALLDAAHIANSASLVKLKSQRSNGKSITVEPTEIAEIEAPAGTDDIRKVIMPMPFNPPSDVLFQLLGWLTDAGKGVIATTEESMQNIGDRTPVGTTMAMIEQGSATYSAIHARLHYSQAKALQILCRINAQFLDDEFVVKELDELIVSRNDFQNSDDICPVSDPNIFSETQRFAQVQGIAQVRAMFPQQPFDENYIARMMLKRMRVEDIDSILPETKKPQNMNPVAENVSALSGNPLLAMPMQNHMAHIKAHIDFAGDNLFCNPTMGGKMLPIMIEHIKQHIGFLYSATMEQATDFAAKVMTTPTRTMEQQLYIAQEHVLTVLNQELAPIMQGLEILQQKMPQIVPQPPTDPSIQATKDVAMADIQRKTNYDNAMIQIEKDKAAQASQNDVAKYQAQLAANNEDNRQHQETELLKNHEDNLTAKWVASLNAAQDQQLQQQQAAMNNFTQLIQNIIGGQTEKMNMIMEAVKHNNQLGHDAQQAELDRQHQAGQNELDRQQTTEQQNADRELAAQQAEQTANQPSSQE